MIGTARLHGLFLLVHKYMKMSRPNSTHGHAPMKIHLFGLVDYALSPDIRHHLLHQWIRTKRAHL